MEEDGNKMFRCFNETCVFSADQLNLIIKELADDAGKETGALLNASKDAGALLRRLAALMRTEPGRGAVLRHAPALVPALLTMLPAAGDEVAPLLEALADTLNELPQLTSCVERLLSDVPEPPWPRCGEVGGGERASKRARLTEPPEPGRRLLAALLTLAARFAPLLRRRWQWVGCLRLLRHRDTETRWLAGRLLALVTAMSPVQTAQLSAAAGVSEQEDVRLSARHLLPPLTSQQPSLTSPETAAQASGGLLSSAPLLVSGDISGALVCVQGVTLPVAAPELRTDGPLAPAVGTCAALRRLALAVAAGRPVLLQGPVGAGKTSLVHHLAEVTGHVGWPRLVTVQLGDQTDSRLLLGTYRCTEVPGQFVWQPGCLTQAVSEGHWLLLEDVDRAPAELASLLVPLLESRTLSTPGHGDVLHAAPGFQLFATQRLVAGAAGGLHRQGVSPAHMLERLWQRLLVEPLPADQLRAIVASQWPRLSSVADRMLEVYDVMTSQSDIGADQTEGMADDGDQSRPVRPGIAQLRGREARMVSTRDLMKWCQRVGGEFDVTSARAADQMFQHAMDIFCAGLSNKDLRLPLAQEIGARLNQLSAHVEFCLSSHKPSVQRGQRHLTVGRARLEIEPAAALSTTPVGAPFSFTRPACILVERVGVAISGAEPVLLVGETGVGKTAVVQFLAEQTGRRLTVVNMSQQSDSGDLLGGYKPVDMKHIMAPLREEFERLFKTTFDATSNEKFLRNIMTVFAAGRWRDLLALMRHVHGQALARLRRRHADPESLLRDWTLLGARLRRLADSGDQQMAMAFAFIEGTLVKAVREGSWVLLDEINLATAETLECLSGLLESTGGPLTLLERGDVQTVPRHPQFRLFACMNPATDVGKRELPPGLRNRFTELFVDELEDEADLRMLVGDYLRHLALPAAQISGVVTFYQRVRQQAAERLTDGTGHRPHYSLRTLCRALRVAAANPCGGALRSLYEALCLSFLTQLDRGSYPLVTGMVETLVLGDKKRKSLLQQPLPAPAQKGYVQFEGYWVQQGKADPSPPEHYVLTASVRQNLRDLARAVALGRQPVLLQGETSAGKTSLIMYLAAASGNKCVRINNHEHTDLQEYVGAYGADASGRLVFQEGALVEAMRHGHWIVLDELNLAPSEVLEALNRVLDDNRQLLVTETQTLVRAHPRFRLFATQNPPGVYGGRKVLSRAFRNRFIELHFDEIPPPELETILQQRCSVPASYCGRMVAVLRDLQTRRRGSSVFQGKQGFITLRDLFRWAERYRLAEPPAARLYDWDQHMADEGYLVLAGRVRRQEECQVVAETLQKHFKRAVNVDNLFSLHDKTSPVTRPVLERLVSAQKGLPEFQHLVWTYPSRRLAVLLCQALRFREPALLVGETGCGKTSVCQLLAAAAGRSLHTVNCHLHTEAADFLGGLRPVRGRTESEEPGRLFEWMDGPLVEAMQGGDYFLTDEISLADDSVLERLNSVLEPERTLLLAEKAGGDGDVVSAAPEFRFVATMNPGGDYGKKELSPALRNRFTEIWCPPVRARADLAAIISHNLQPKDPALTESMLDFVEWLAASEAGKHVTVSVRDVLAWVRFINVAAARGVPAWSGYVHGGRLVFADGLGSGQAGPSAALRTVRAAAQQLLQQQAAGSAPADCDAGALTDTQTQFGFAPFLIDKGDCGGCGLAAAGFSLAAATPAENARRLLRALQLPRPVLLEGSPGVGKTSLVAALARAAGHRITRINLSEQTDVSDLFGADLPEEGGTGGQFAWRDGPLLRALRAGHWILLDELNLASQSVLEGLNACLDHRGAIYVPELGREFHLRAGATRIFACQNPLLQGGARKGLPRSFLNRFTQVFLEPLTSSDLETIVLSTSTPPAASAVRLMVQFNCRLHDAVNQQARFGQRGGPWEFNLRDISRWCELLAADGQTDVSEQEEARRALQHVQLLYADRMRSAADRAAVLQLAAEVFGERYERPACHLAVTRELLTVGRASLWRESDQAHVAEDSALELQVLRGQLPVLESIMRCLDRGWMTILVGPAESGKTSVVRTLAALAGRRLHVLNVNAAMDTTELLGGFEQAEPRRRLELVLQRTEQLLWAAVRTQLLAGDSSCGQLLKLWQQLQRFTADPGGGRTTAEEAQQLVSSCEAAAQLLSQLPGEEPQQLASRLERLREEATRDGGASGGGRFEWVDSLLVKALRAGDWLLVDNVNFCAASVLDRLNALLEPGGVLELSERGVLDGGVPTVRPHPQFRLLLAMDPRHGEISRAMRNRGVELYLPGPADSDGGAAAALDTAALLSGGQLPQLQLQAALLQLHAAAVQHCSGWERPGLRDLLSCARLTSQMMCRGASPRRALMDAATDAYVSPLLSGSSRAQLLRQLSELLDGSWEQQLQQLSPQLCAGPVALYLADCDLARARQMWASVERHLGAGESHSAALPLLHSYRHALAAVSARGLHYLQSAAVGARDPLLRRLGEEDAVELLQPGEVPLPPLEAPPARQLLLLLRLSRAAQREPELTAAGGASLLVLSAAAESGLVAVRALPHPAVALLVPLLRRLDSVVTRLLESSPPPELVAAWRRQLPWRLRLAAACCQPTQQQLESWLPPLALLWRWVSEHLVSALPPDRELEELCVRLKGALDSEISAGAQLARQLTELLPRPRPFPDGGTATLHHQLCRVSWAMDPYCGARPPDASRPEVPPAVWRALLTAEDAAELRERLTSAICCLLTSERHSQSAEETLQSALQLLHSRGLLQRADAAAAVTSEEDAAAEVAAAAAAAAEDAAEGRPQGALVALLETLLRRKEAALVADPAPTATLRQFADVQAGCSVRAPLYQALWRAVSVGDAPEEQRQTLQQQLTASYLATAGSDPRVELWLPTDSEQEPQELELQQVNPRLFSAEITHIVAADLRAPAATLLQESVSIGDVSRRCRQMAELRRLLWHNHAALADPRHDSRLALRRLVETSWRRFIAALSQATANVDVSLGDVIVRLEIEGRLTPEQASWLRSTQAVVESAADRPTELGAIFVYVGAAQMAVLGQMMAVDPVEERKILLDYYRNEVQDVECDLAAAEAAFCVLSGAVPSPLPPVLAERRQWLQQLQQKVSELDAGQAWRPTPPRYTQLRQEVQGFLSSAGSLSTLSTLLAASAEEAPPSHLLARLRGRLTSLSSFLAGLEARYSGYRDLTAPLTAAGRQVEFGLRVLLYEAQRRQLQLQLPASLQLQPTLLQLASWLQPASLDSEGAATGALLTAVRDPAGPDLTAQWAVRLLQLTGQELTARLRLTGTVSTADVSRLVQRACRLWQEQERRRQEHQQEQDSLYRTKTHCAENDTEEEQALARQVAEMFPDYSDTYADLSGPTLDGGGADSGAVVRLEPELTVEALSELWQLQEAGLQACTAARWLPEPSQQQEPADLLRPFCHRYALLAVAGGRLSPLLDASADAPLALSHLVAAAAVEASVQPDTAALAPTPLAKPYDVYRDSHVAEVSRCRGPLRRLDARCAELLCRWPQQPALEAVRRCVARVLSQPAAAPLLKVVTGLELVLERAQQWQENAHSGVSLAPQLAEVTDLILAWRQLELHCWKRCLDAAAYQVEVDAARWMPHLQSLLQEQLQQPAPLQQLAATLQQFVEGGALGEFAARLRMLLSVHRQIVAERGAAAAEGELGALLWNLHQYYQQLYPAVETHLRTLRKPVEQKVKDFVKIARWNDTNFWSVKDAVKKSHRILLKHVKEFQAILRQPVSAALQEPALQDGAEAEEQAVSEPDAPTPQLYLATESVQVAESPYPDEQRLSRLPRLYRRSRRLCRALYTRCQLPADSSALDCVTGDICGTADELGKLNVDGVSEPERRKKLAGQHRQRRRLALAELYRTLTGLGASHRRGLVAQEQQDVVLSLLAAPPVGVMSFDGRLDAAWRQCVKYECRVVARAAQLRRALVAPHRELGPQHLERLRGFSADLLTALVSMRRLLAGSESAVSRLAALLHQAAGLSSKNGATDHSATQRRCREAEPRLQQLGVRCVELLARLRLLLLAAPADHAPPSLLLSDPAPEAATLLPAVETELTRARAVCRRLRRDGPRRWCGAAALLWTPSDAHRLKEADRELTDIGAALCRIRDQLCPGAGAESALAATLAAAAEELSQVRPDPPPPESECERGAAVERRFVSGARRLTTRVLSAVQRVYRAAETEQPRSEEDALLSARLQARLAEAAAQLDTAEVADGLQRLVRVLATQSVSDQHATRMIALLGQLVPLLRQYQLLCTFHLQQQMAAFRASAKLLSVLLKIFTALVQKGFCTPDDVPEEEGEAGTEFKEVESGGLGEAQGAKDVSDKLESEDQLEGAHQQGETPPDADEEVKEEEHGVEMSEDFGGEMQDVEGREEEQRESGDEEEEDPDKQMGEVDGEDQEVLDEKLWGSDAEDEEDQRAEDAAEDQKGGQGREDEHLAAKEDDETADSKSNEQRERKEQKENEMEEDEDQQADPHHNDFPAGPEPEDLQLPDREDADSEHGAESDGSEEGDDTNPWDIEQRADFDEPERPEPEKEEEQAQEQEPTDKQDGAAEEQEQESEEDEEEAGREEKRKTDEKGDAEDVDQEMEQEAATVDSSQEPGEAAEENAAEGTQDRLQQPRPETAAEQPTADTAAADNEERAGVGMADSSSGGHQAAAAAEAASRPRPEPPEKTAGAERRRPGRTDSKRSLAGADDMPVEKRLKTVDADETEMEDGGQERTPAPADLLQHIQDSEQQHDALTVDAATREQAEERPAAATQAEDAPPPAEEEELVPDQSTEEEKLPDQLETVPAERLSGRRRDRPNQEGPDGPERAEVEGEVVPTATVQRPAESTAHTAVTDEEMVAPAEVAPQDLQRLREELQNSLQLWCQAADGLGEQEAELAWQQCEAVITPLAQELCEQLRLILEPTQTAQLKGDYRTGKRLNMRKVIPYIASQFRKDKIWLRRTKPSKRDYRVVLAVDDSSSMSDNRSRQLAFESVALVSRALALLEAGQLAVVSFGEETRLLHGLQQAASAAAGAQVLRRLTFAQTRTRVAAMLDSVTALLSGGGGGPTAQLLLVVSDGRGIFHEGREPVRAAIHRARQAGIFLVFVVVDSPESKDSVLDIRVPQFGATGQLLGIHPYMDQFPFPYYLILRDIAQLPAVLSDALRQWFELVTASDR